MSGHFIMLKLRYNQRRSTHFIFCA